MPAGEVIASYHDLWHVEQSFRMSKTDLAARPIFHRTLDAIEAHLTIVFTALAIARDLQARSSWSIRKIVHDAPPAPARHHQRRRPATTGRTRDPRRHGQDAQNSGALKV